ncbi:MAG: DUF2914 domain-containing protein [Candidatus Binatia bacterium]
MPQYFMPSLIVLVALVSSPSASAEQKLIDVVFARDVVNREPVRPFEPPAYCEKEAGPSRPVPIIESGTEGRVFFWNRIESSSSEAALRHTWYKNGVKLAEINLRVRRSPGFRTWSVKKIIPKHHVGKWKIVVSTANDPAGVLCVAHFVVK